MEFNNATAADYANARADDAHKEIQELRKEVVELRRLIDPGYDERVAKEEAERSTAPTFTLADALKEHYHTAVLTSVDHATGTITLEGSK